VERGREISQGKSGFERISGLANQNSLVDDGKSVFCVGKRLKNGS
jgi:hypothetical protein